MVYQQVHAGGKPWRWIIVIRHLGVQTFEIGIVQDTLLIGIVQEGAHRRIFAATLDTQLVIVGYGGTGSLFLPVGIVNRGTIGTEETFIGKDLRKVSREIPILPFVGILQTLFEGSHPLVSIHHIHKARHITHRQ